MTDVVILSAGGINFTNIPLDKNSSNSMVPVNGKPVISWILDDVLKQSGVGRILVVVRMADLPLKEFVSRVYNSRFSIEVAEVSGSGSILESLNAGLRLVRSHGVRIILGDTLIQSVSGVEDSDVVFVHEVDDSSRWCLALIDESQQVVSYIDKQPNIPPPHYALCGYYVFSNAMFLAKQLALAISEDKTQLSDLLFLYQQKYPLKAVYTDSWFDFGNADNFFNAKQRLLQGRFFNSLQVDPVMHTITKVSDLDQKLRNELQWYEQLPDILKVLTPRIVAKEEKDSKLWLTQEYYGYPTLSELFIYSNLNAEAWHTIFKNLLTIHNRLKSYTGDSESIDAITIYRTKTIERLNAARKLDRGWGFLFDARCLSVNGRRLNGLPYFRESLERAVDELIGTISIGIIHGDFCFSNILYDPYSHIVRLIDPRGNFGKDGIFGDPRYDIAKLRHSACGYYDYIVSDLFSLSQSGPDFSFDIYCRDETKQISKLFDSVIEANGYILTEIKLIEALLFLSMIPYHQDKPQRQKAMFITGILRLNELME